MMVVGVGGVDGWVCVMELCVMATARLMGVGGGRCLWLGMRDGGYRWLGIRDGGCRWLWIANGCETKSSDFTEK